MSEVSLVPELELPPQNPFEQLSALGEALESFHTQLKTRTYVGGSNPVAETLLQLAPVASLEDYSDCAFGPALEASQNSLRDVIFKMLAWVKEMALKIYHWFKDKFKVTVEAEHAKFETAVDALQNVDDAVRETDQVLPGIPAAETAADEDPEAKANRTKETFVDSFARGIGAGVVRLSFKEEPWLKFLSLHIKLCVRITKDVSHSEDLFGAVLAQRKSLKGQLAGDVRKATDARFALAKALGLDTEDSRSVSECIQESVRFIHLVTHSTNVKVNPKFVLTNTPSVASMMLAMDSKEYRNNAVHDLAEAEKRLSDVEAGITRIEAQITERRDELNAEDSAQLREYIKELQQAANGLYAGSQFHISYVKAHTKIIDSFADYYRAVAALSAQKHSAETLAQFNKQLK